MLAHLQVVGDKQHFKCRYNRWRIETHFMGKLNCYKILQVHKGTIKMWLLHTYCPHSSKKVGKTLRRCLITNEYKLTLVAYYVQTAYKSIIIVTSFLLYITSSSTLPCSMHLRKWHLPGASKTCRNLRVFSTALSLPVSCCQAILEATGSNLDTREMYGSTLKSLRKVGISDYDYLKWCLYRSNADTVILFKCGMMI